MKFKFTLEVIILLFTLIDCVITHGANNMIIPMLLVSAMSVRIGYEAKEIW
ncbi:hypothetical protein HYH68_16220 [Clostridium botulinum]|uniref:hypothetical protein n=1 Tax=Clostridium botulinum TaxID=1491 RepID=UPI001C9B6D0D|nr:hypothetical protein [Clostridium botulinum]MBY6889338.1 hypothetical protein [Clostridium botulinum]